MEGYLPADLVNIIERSFHCTFQRDPQNPMLKMQDVEKAMKSYTPRGLTGVSLHKSSVRWEDVGGRKSAILVCAW